MIRGHIVLAIIVSALVSGCGGGQDEARAQYAQACEDVAVSEASTEGAGDGAATPLWALTVAVSSDRLICELERDAVLVAFDAPGWAEARARYPLNPEGEAIDGATIATKVGEGRSICRLDRWGRGGCAACPAPGLARSGVVRRVVADWVKRDPNRYREAPPPIDVDTELERLAGLCEAPSLPPRL